MAIFVDRRTTGDEDEAVPVPPSVTAHGDFVAAEGDRSRLRRRPFPGREGGVEVAGSEKIESQEIRFRLFFRHSVENLQPFVSKATLN